MSQTQPTLVPQTPSTESAPTTIQGASLAFVLTDAHGRVVGWSAGAEKLFECASEVALGQDFVSWAVQASDAPAYQRQLEAAVNDPGASTPFACQVKSVHATSHPVQCALYAAPAASDMRVWHGILDLTHRRSDEQLLRRALSHHQRLMRSLRSIVISVDMEGRITEWNPAAETVLGLEAELTLGQALADLPIGWPKERVKAAVDEALKTCAVVALDDLPFRPRPDAAGVLGLTLTPMLDDRGEHHGALILGADVTSRRGLENQLAQAQRLESIGRLAAGIAHEINTPTQFVGDNIRFLRDSIQDLLGLLATYEEALAQPPDAQEAAREKVAAEREAIDLEFLEEEIPNAISQSINGVERIASIVRAMKEFSHPSHESKAPSDLNQALESTLVVARNEWKYVADVNFELDADLPSVPCHLGELNQVFLNLIVNAAHAVAESHPEGVKGNIRVRTRVEEGLAVIEIQDDGCGMDEATLARAFDPFFTTKEVGRGTGQGLALAHDVIVNKHKGKIDVTSGVGVGSTFTVRLPLSIDEPELLAAV